MRILPTAAWLTPIICIVSFNKGGSLTTSAIKQSCLVIFIYDFVLVNVL